MEKDYSMEIYPYLMVGIDLDTADDIVAKRLEQQFWELEPYIGSDSVSGSEGCPMFSTDKEENQRMTDELKDAFIKVLEYNGVYIVKKRGKYVRRAK